MSDFEPCCAVINLAKFDRLLFDCYRLAAQKFPYHADVWKSLALAKLSRIRIYKTIIDEIKIKPVFFDTAIAVTGFFINFSHKVRNTRGRLQKYQIPEDEFLILALHIEKAISRSRFIPSIKCCNNNYADRAKTLKNVQERQTRLLMGFAEYKSILV